MKIRTVAVIIGTRPEAIKMAPVILELKKNPAQFRVVVISSGQHREMLDDPLSVFNIKPDYDLKLMKPYQSLFDISKGVLGKVEKIFKAEKPDLVLIQGDTPTAFMGALSGFYNKTPIAHVEAGLRTYDKYNPFPEEMNRQMIDVLTDLFFAPTKEAAENLLKEGKSKSVIRVTGNTAIDAVLLASKRKFKSFKNQKLNSLDFESKKIIFLECHRRESWGAKMEEIFKGVGKIVEEFPEAEVVFPVHPNPIIQKSVKQIFQKSPGVHLFPPLNYLDMVWLMQKCYFIATDSGGLQEEVPTFHKPVLVLRDVTERTEGIKTGTLKLAGTSELRVYEAMKQLLTVKKLYKKMSEAKNPYGDGKASAKITSIIKEFLESR